MPAPQLKSAEKKAQGEAKQPKAKRENFFKAEQARGRMCVRLNVQQARDLAKASNDAHTAFTLVATDLSDTAKREITRALSAEGKPRWYWDETLVIFVPPTVVAELYQWSYNRREQENGGRAHLLGARSILNRQFDQHGFPEHKPQDLEKLARAEAAA